MLADAGAARFSWAVSPSIGILFEGPKGEREKRHGLLESDEGTKDLLSIRDTLDEGDPCGNGTSFPGKEQGGGTDQPGLDIRLGSCRASLITTQELGTFLPTLISESKMKMKPRTCDGGCVRGQRS
jgi:hypothetical protein